MGVIPDPKMAFISQFHVFSSYFPTGFVQKWENRIPGLFQDYSRTFFRFLKTQFLPNLNKKNAKNALFSARNSEVEIEKKGTLVFFDSDDKNWDYRTY